VPCWSCHAAVPPGAPSCPACGRVQPPGPDAEADPFAALGLPRAFSLDPALLEARFRERSRHLHPDRFARADPRERRFALERATRVNDAWRTLRDPRRRAAALLRLLGRDPAAEARAGEAPEFLEALLAVRERLALARATGEEAAGREVAAEARGRLAALDDEVARLFAEGDPGVETLDAIARALARARYWEALAEDAEAPMAAGPRR
jgi:molecular chaperone HscB